MSHAWFRFYNDVIGDPKLGKLSDAHFRVWVNLLCMASKGAGVITNDIDELAYALRKPRGKIADLLQVFISATLLERCSGGYTPHNWPERQYKSDGSTERVKRFRERSKTVSPPVTETKVETGPDTEQIQIQKEVRLEVAQSLPKIIDPDNLSLPSFLDRSTRWPRDAVVTEDWICDGLQARLDAGLEFIELRSEAANFADYWASKPGKDAKKLDWHKTWLVWARNAKRHGYAARPSANDRFLAGGAAFIAELERAEAIGEGENNLFDAGGSSGPALLQARRSGGTG